MQNVIRINNDKWVNKFVNDCLQAATSCLGLKTDFLRFILMSSIKYESTCSFNLRRFFSNIVSCFMQSIFKTRDHEWSFSRDVSITKLSYTLKCWSVSWMRPSSNEVQLMNEILCIEMRANNRMLPTIEITWTQRTRVAIVAHASIAEKSSFTVRCFFQHLQAIDIRVLKR